MAKSKEVTLHIVRGPSKDALKLAFFDSAPLMFTGVKVEGGKTEMVIIIDGIKVDKVDPGDAWKIEGAINESGVSMPMTMDYNSHYRQGKITYTTLEI